MTPFEEGGIFGVLIIKGLLILAGFLTGRSIYKKWKKNIEEEKIIILISLMLPPIY